MKNLGDRWWEAFMQQVEMGEPMDDAALLADRALALFEKRFTWGGAPRKGVSGSQLLDALDRLEDFSQMSADDIAEELGIAPREEEE